MVMMKIYLQDIKNLRQIKATLSKLYPQLKIKTVILGSDGIMNYIK
jgi:hypothetical protein